MTQKVYELTRLTLNFEKQKNNFEIVLSIEY